MKYDLALVPARINPLHNGHLNLIDEAFRVASDVLILVGSAQESGTEKNPLCVRQRIELVTEVYPQAFAVGIADTITDELWIEEIRRAVEFTASPDERICVMTSNKDDDYELRKGWFYGTGWEVLSVNEVSGISATQVRDMYRAGECIRHMVPEETINFIESLPNGLDFE